MLTKKEALEIFKRDIMPRIPANDRPAMSEAWCNFTDSLVKDKLVSREREETWSNPF